MWGGRFSQSTDELVASFNASVGFDQRLAHDDITGSIAHAKMLNRAGILTDEELDAIVEGLQNIDDEITEGNFSWSEALEDVHMNIEAALTARIGEAGKKLHTGRSRNDQVATDIRLYMRRESREVRHGIRELQRVIADIAEREHDAIMPGFTHLQSAQPITFGHHMLAWFEMLDRDHERFLDGEKRINRLPLGAAALAGTSFPIDRDYTRELLGFDSVSANSLDAVSDRDFLIEFCNASALLMTHLSRMSEELILWSTSQFGFIELGDAFCTGSSIMPQKKNPDIPELVRGKSARVIGHLIGLLVLMKGQPLAYNKDNQEDKEPVFDALDTVKTTVVVFAKMLETLELKRERTLQAASSGHSTATDLADYLVRAGLPFRDAHEVVGTAVRIAIDSGRELHQLELSEFQALSPHIEQQVYGVLTVEGSVAARDHVGGTAPKRVLEAARQAKLRAEDSD
jgi:argininosuccinate lyase